MKDKENIKIGLLAVIALTLIINTFMPSGDNKEVVQNDVATVVPPPSSTIAAPPASNIAAPSDIISAETSAPLPINKVPSTTVKFEQESFDFGKIKQDTENKHIFKFTNTGKAALIIENAVGSCGCTVPKYPKEPIAPGKTGEIEVVYSPGKQKGNQNKTVTITANTEPSTLQIQISAFVEEVAEAK